MRSIVLACLLLTGTLLLAFPLFAWYGWATTGATGLLCAAIALGACLAGGIVALIVIGLARNPSQAVSAVMLGMLFRMGIPLASGFLLHSQGGPLAEAGVLGMIVVYYLLSLPVDTVLSLKLVAQAKRPVQNPTQANPSQAL